MVVFTWRRKESWGAITLKSTRIRRMLMHTHVTLNYCKVTHHTNCCTQTPADTRKLSHLDTQVGGEEAAAREKRNGERDRKKWVRGAVPTDKSVLLPSFPDNQSHQ